MYGIAIYENGEIIDPSQDVRLKDINLPWIKQDRVWANQMFSRSEIMQLFTDLYNISLKLNR